MKKYREKISEEQLCQLFGEKGRSFSEERIRKGIASVFNNSNGILVCGSYGKTAASNMLYTVLSRSSFDPVLLNLGRQTDIRLGMGGFSILNPGDDLELLGMLKPSMTVLTGVYSKEENLETQMKLHEKNIKNAQVGAVINADCMESVLLRDINSNTLVYSTRARADVLARNIRSSLESSSCTVGKEELALFVAGKLNIPGALACIAAGEMLGLGRREIATHLSRYKGSSGTLMRIGSMAGVSIFYDETDHPASMAVVLESMKAATDSRITVLFSPDKNRAGEEYAESFAALKPHDAIAVCDTFGRPKTCESLVKSLKKMDLAAKYYPNRRDTVRDLVAVSNFGDVILLLGPKDDGFDDFCSKIWLTLENKVL